MKRVITLLLFFTFVFGIVYLNWFQYTHYSNQNQILLEYDSE